MYFQFLLAGRVTIAVATAIALALVAVLATRRFGYRATVILAVAAILACSAYALATWLPEKPDRHFTNPDLSRIGDLVLGHFGFWFLFLVVPALTGLAVVSRLDRGTWPAWLRALGAASAMLAMLLVTASAALILGIAVYRDGPYE